MTDSLRIEFLPLSSLQSAKRNPKKHAKAQIAESFARFGAVEPPALDGRTGRLVAGHGRIETLREMKAAEREPPAGVRVDDSGDWLVPVLAGWSSTNDADAAAYLLASNKLTALGGWEETELGAMLRELADADALTGVGFSDKELRKMLAEVVEEPDEPDELPAHAKETWVRSGDLFKLGAHRLLVGDSTDAADVARLLGDDGETTRVDLVATDPPYAIFGSATGQASDIADDKMVRPFFEAVARLVAARLKWFGHAYLFTDWRSWSAMWEGAKRAGLAPKNQLVWDKKGSGLGSSYAMTYELIGFFANLPPQTGMGHRAAGQRVIHKPNVLRFNRPSGEERLHNAAKPVALMAELIENSTDAGETVFDPFSGSGSTLIACEKTGRRCFAMEIDPKNAQIIVERWERITGLKAEKTE